MLPKRAPDWYTEGMETVPRQTRLHRVGARYYIRVKVPADLREAIGKREIKEALGTSDPREAAKRLHKRSVAVDELFDAHRRRLTLKQAALTLASKADLDRVALQAFHEQERARADDEPPHPWELEEALEYLREDQALLSEGLSDATLPSLQGTAVTLLEQSGLVAPPVPRISAIRAR